MIHDIREHRSTVRERGSVRDGRCSLVVELWIMDVNDVTINYVCVNFVMSPLVSGCVIGYL